MMKETMKALWLIAILILSSACVTQKKVTALNKDQCAEFRTGTFEMIDESRNHKSIIFREDTVQVEKQISPVDSEMTLKVTWLDDCSYKLSNAVMDGSTAFDLVLIVEIDSIRGKRMYFTTYPEKLEGLKQQFFMTKIDD